MIKIFKSESRKLHTDIDTYIVHWWNRYGEFHYEEKENYQAFTSEEEAKAFAHELRRAFKLIGTTYHSEVTVKKQSRNTIEK